MRTIQELGDTLDGVDAQIKEMEKDRAKLLDKVHRLQAQMQEASYGLSNTDTVLKNLRAQRDETLAYIQRIISRSFKEQEIPF